MPDYFLFLAFWIYSQCALATIELNKHSGPHPIGEIEINWDWPTAPTGMVGYSVKIFERKKNSSTYTLINWDSQSGSMVVDLEEGDLSYKFEGCYIDPNDNYQEVCGNDIITLSFWGYVTPTVEKFSWTPSTVALDEESILTWDIKHISICIIDNEGPPKSGSGTLGPYTYSSATTITTLLYCYDLGGQRYPESGYLQAKLRVLAPSKRKVTFIHTDLIGTPVAESY